MTAIRDVAGHAPGARRSLRELDLLMVAVVVLCCLGLVVAVSVQGPQRGALTALQGQSSKLLLALCVFLGCAALPLRTLHKLAQPMFLVATLLCLAAALLFRSTNGAHRWIRLTDSLTFQPVELARFAMIVLLASVIARLGDDARRFRAGFLRILAPPLLLAGTLVLQPDLGNAIFAVAIAVVMAIAAGVRWQWFLTTFAVLGAGVLWHVQRRAYAQDRISGFLDVKDGSQVGQSMTAIASGGLSGRGLGNGWMKMGFVPEAGNDFVFAVIGEELGLVGGCLVVALFGLIAWVGWRLVLATGDRFCKFLVLGFTTALCLQATLNLYVVTGMAPAKGIDLPFLSSGGTNLAFALAAVGVIGNAARTDAAARQSFVRRD